jgi:hypothetical protein
VVDAAGEIYGDAPNIAARVQALAEPGTVVVTARVQHQVAGLFVVEERGSHELKGVPEPVTLYRLVRASGGGRRARQRHLTPLVGREEEIAMLVRRWERARQGEGQLVMIVGEPGLTARTHLIGANRCPACSVSRPSCFLFSQCIRIEPSPRTLQHDKVPALSFVQTGRTPTSSAARRGTQAAGALNILTKRLARVNEQMDRQDQHVAHERQIVTSADQHNTEPGRDSCWKLRIRHPQDSEAKTSASASGGPPPSFCEVSRTRPVPGMIGSCSQRILLHRGRRGDLLDQSCTAISCVG